MKLPIITVSGNKVIQKLLKEFGMFEFTPEEFEKKLPDAYKLLMDSETKKDFDENEKIYMSFKKKETNN